MTTAAPPRSGAELEALLSDPDKVNAAVSDGTFADVIKAYARDVKARDEHFAARLEEQVQAAVADMLRDNAAIPVRPPVHAGTTTHDRVPDRGQRHNPKALGAVLDGKFDTLADLVVALGQERRGDQAAARRLGELRNAWSSTVPSEGGFLVPEEYRAELVRVMLESAIVRPLARVIPMSVPRISWPVLDATSNASSVHGGVIGYWTEEGAALAASSPRFGRISLDAAKLTAYTEIPNELLSDSAPSVGPLVDQMFPEALAWFEDRAFISGPGVGQPLGFLGADAAVTVSKESSQPADTLLWANVVKMYARMLPTSLGRAVWVMNNQLVEQLLQMTLPVRNVAGTENVGGSAVGITYGAGAGTPSYTLLGRPIILSEKLPAIGDLGDVNFVDLGYYLIGDMQQISAMTSEHFRFNTDSVAYRVITRVDGRPGLLSAITPANGGNALSPFVKLEAR